MHSSFSAICYVYYYEMNPKTDEVIKWYWNQFEGWQRYLSLGCKLTERQARNLKRRKKELQPHIGYFNAPEQQREKAQ